MEYTKILHAYNDHPKVHSDDSTQSYYFDPV